MSDAGGSSQEVPESQGSVSRQTVSIEELMIEGGRLHCVKLHPTILDGVHTWFKKDIKGHITKAILGIFKSRIDQPYPKYSDISPQLKTLFFRTFAYSFSWEPNLTTIVEKEFHKQAALTYSSHMSDWKKKWRKDPKDKPKGMCDLLWEGYGRYWELEETKVLSATNTHNKLSDRHGTGPATHNGGPKSIGAHERQLTIDNGGEAPTFVELVRVMHTNKKTGEIQYQRVKDILTSAEAEIDERLTQLPQEGSSEAVLSREERNKIFLSHAPTVKGRTLGLGRLPQEHVSSTSMRTSEETLHLLEQIEDLKAARDNLAQSQKETQADLEMMKGYMKRMFPDLDFPGISGN